MPWTVIKNPEEFPVKFCMMAETGRRVYGAFNLMGVATYRYASRGGWCSLLRNGDRWRIGEHRGGNIPHLPIFEGTAWEVAEWIAVNANVMRTRDGLFLNSWVFPFDYREDGHG